MGRLLRVNQKQHALGVEILAEMKAQKVSAVEMRRRTGINAASWTNWFVTASNPVKWDVVEQVCDELGVPVSEMARRAEVRVGYVKQPPTAEVVEAALSGMSPEAQAAVRDMRRHMGHEVEPESNPGKASNG